MSLRRRGGQMIKKEVGRCGTGSFYGVMGSLRFGLGITVLLVFAGGCAEEAPGPDKQGGGMLSGAALGAGAGAIAGAQLSSATGPGALAGAGFGAVAGAVRGMVQDSLEREAKLIADATASEQERARAHKILAQHFDRRLRLHPTRDIYPADLFFYADSTKLRNEAVGIVNELAVLNKDRLPWSRLVVACYVKSRDPKEENNYGRQLAERRAEALSNHFVRRGIDPRRIEARSVLIDEPVVIDETDDPLRYAQAVEILPFDR
jgi:outer membrane protein OmpA-like peptidoglycan-associated protein